MIEFCNYKWTTAMEGGRIIHEQMPWMWYDCDAVYVEDGTAELNAYREPNTIHHWDGNTYRPTVACGLLRSVDTFGYGTYSADIKLPKGRNLWPSFWLVGEGKWPDNGEIDIMEAWSNGIGSYYRFPLCWRTTNNVHYSENDTHKQIGSKNVSLIKQPHNPTERFVNYSVEWRPNKLTFFVNGKVTREVGWDVCTYFARDRMHVVFDLWTDTEEFTCDTPMKIRNFEYKPLISSNGVIHRVDILLRNNGCLCQEEATTPSCALSEPSSRLAHSSLASSRCLRHPPRSRCILGSLLPTAHTC